MVDERACPECDVPYLRSTDGPYWESQCLCDEQRVIDGIADVVERRALEEQRRTVFRDGEVLRTVDGTGFDIVEGLLHLPKRDGAFVVGATVDAIDDHGHRHTMRVWRNGGSLDTMRRGIADYGFQGFLRAAMCAGRIDFYPETIADVQIQLRLAG